MSQEQLHNQNSIIKHFARHKHKLNHEDEQWVINNLLVHLWANLFPLYVAITGCSVPKKSPSSHSKPRLSAEFHSTISTVTCLKSRSVILRVEPLGFSLVLLMKLSLQGKPKVVFCILLERRGLSSQMAPPRATDGTETPYDTTWAYTNTHTCTHTDKPCWPITD